MKHNHSCSCEHENVKFCKVCKVVHCLDCNQEWRTYTTWYYGQWYNQNLASAGQAQYQGPIYTNTGQSNINSLGCKHA